jgi:hypothetical protein
VKDEYIPTSVRTDNAAIGFLNTITSVKASRCVRMACCWLVMIIVFRGGFDTGFCTRGFCFVPAPPEGVAEGVVLPDWAGLAWPE